MFKPLLERTQVQLESGWGRGDWKLGAGAYVKGGTQCALPCCASTSEGAGVSASSFLGHDPPALLASSSWSGLLETTASSDSSRCPGFQAALVALPLVLCPYAWGPRFLWNSNSAVLHCHLECPRNPIPVLCTLPA